MDDLWSSPRQKQRVLHHTVRTTVKINGILLVYSGTTYFRSDSELGQSLQYWEECFTVDSDVVPTFLQPIAEKVSQYCYM